MVRTQESGLGYSSAILPFHISLNSKVYNKLKLLRSLNYIYSSISHFTELQ